MNIQSASRKDIHDFYQWTKSLPKYQTQFLYHSYLKEEIRQQQLKELFNQWKSQKINNN